MSGSIARRDESTSKFKDTPGPAGGGQELEVGVHTSLPPRVTGAIRGHVSVSVRGPVEWECNVRPPAPRLSLRLRWWGEKTPGALFRVPVMERAAMDGDATTSVIAYYPIRASLPQFKTYLRDMGAMSFEVGLGHMTDSSMVIGCATVPNIASLPAKGRINRKCPVKGAGEVHLGLLHVVFQLHIKDAPSEKGGAKKGRVTFSTMEKDGRGNIEEFVVGPGVKAMMRKSSSNPARVIPSSSGRHEHGGNEPKLTGDKDILLREVRELDRHGDGDRIVMGKGVGSDGGGGGGACVREGVHTERPRTKAMTIGREQMELISELLERGTRLRDKMVQSLTTNTTSAPAVGSSEVKGLLTAEELALMSAELNEMGVVSEMGVTTALYTEHSSSDDDGHCGMSDGDEDTLVCGNSHHPSNSSSLPDRDSTADASRGRVVPLKDEGGVVPPKDRGGVVPPKDEGGMVPPKDRGGVVPPKDRGGVVPPKDRGGVVPPKDEGGMVPPKDRGGPKTSVRSNGSKDIPSGEKVETLSGRFGKGQDGLSTLAGRFGKGENFLEHDISSSIGIEQLTRLGRATSVRLVVGTLQVDSIAVNKIISYKNRDRKRPSIKMNPFSSTTTYFVEYQFPTLLADPPKNSSSSSSLSQLHEVIRVACKKIVDGEVNFNHRSVFPVLFNNMVLQKWWTTNLAFRIYCRAHHERMPCLIGRATAPLRACLISPTLQSRLTLQVHSPHLAGASPHTDPCIGQVQISMEMMMNKKTFPPLKSPLPLNPSSPSKRRRREEEEEPSAPTMEAIKLKEQTPVSTDIRQSKSLNLQLVLLIPEGTDITLSSPSPPLPSPNPYLICKLFCAHPSPKTPVQWGTPNPQFLFRQVFHLTLTSSLVEKFCNNFSVVEVWHRNPREEGKDMLVGLVKLSLHQFYLSFSDPSSSLSTQDELPVVAVDTYCPIMDPISGESKGHLGVLLAVGTHLQVSGLLSQYVSGSVAIKRPHTSEARRSGYGDPPISPGDLTSTADTVHHQFHVCVEGVRGLEVPPNTAWGETDCYMQYHFPAHSTTTPNSTQEELVLLPHRTPTTLYIPNPSLSHEVSHSLSLARGQPIGSAIAKAYGQGMNTSVTFELWKRFYYPNIRDQLMAKARLPLVKLCALVSMQPASTTCSQTFSLPLTPLPSSSEDRDSTKAVLDVTIRYGSQSSEQDKQSSLVEAIHVNLSLGILRMAGLKRAAMQASKERPLPLNFSAEVGVNSYARIRAPEILKTPLITKTVARSFAPELSHFFELSLPLIQGEVKSNNVDEGVDEHVDGRIHRGVSPIQFLHTSLLVEVWHQVPRKEGVSTPIGRSGIFGRRLGPCFQDVLLGVAPVPLRALLTDTGLHGWYPLLPPNTPHHPPVSGPSPLSHHPPPEVECAYLGSIEMSAVFASKEDRELVFSYAQQSGWEPPRMMGVTGVGGAGQWEVKIQISGLWLELVGDRAEMSCFIRYGFFDLAPVSSLPRRHASTQEGGGGGVVYYPIQHTSHITLPSSPQLEWYLYEESLEVQVWACRSGLSPAAASEETLVGSVYIPLSHLLSKGGHISEWCPVYKGGAEDLGRQAIHIQLDLSPASGERAPGLLVLDLPEAEQAPPPAQAPPPTLDTGEATDKLRAVTFEARIILHQALHLPLLSDIKRAEYLPSAYVSVHPHPSVEKVATDVVPSCLGPSWNYQFLTFIPNGYLVPENSGLEFQVWSHEDEDKYIGCASVDLSPLAFGLAHLSGWYHILDFTGEMRGQLKVSIIPTERLSFPKTSLPLPSHSTISQITQISGHSISPKPDQLITTSLLFQQLRDNMQELDHINQHLQAKLQADQHPPHQPNLQADQHPPHQPNLQADQHPPHQPNLQADQHPPHQPNLQADQHPPHQPNLQADQHPPHQPNLQADQHPPHQPNLQADQHPPHQPNLQADQHPPHQPNLQADQHPPHQPNLLADQNPPLPSLSPSPQSSLHLTDVSEGEKEDESINGDILEGEEEEEGCGWSQGTGEWSSEIREVSQEMSDLTSVEYERETHTYQSNKHHHHSPTELPPQQGYCDTELPPQQGHNGTAQQGHSGTELPPQQGYCDTELPPQQGHSGTEFPPQQGHSGSELPPQQGYCDTELPPQQGHSGTEFPPQQGHSGTELPPQQGHSGTELPPQQGHSGTELPPQQGHSGTAQQGHSGTEFPPQQGYCDTELPPQQGHSGTELPPQQGHSGTELPPQQGHSGVSGVIGNHSNSALVHTSRCPLSHLDEPCLPNFFLSPHQLEESLRRLRASALSRVPPSRLPPHTPVPPPQAPPQVRETDHTAKWRTPEETQRIARIFSSRPN